MRNIYSNLDHLNKLRNYLYQYLTDILWILFLKSNVAKFSLANEVVICNISSFTVKQLNK